jgi:hypothetical protein
MIISFSITNFRSIKEEQVFSMLADTSLERQQASTVTLEQYKNLEVVKTAVLYGKNNAGKSNTLKALKAFQWLVRRSNDLAPHDSIKANEYFLYDRQRHGQPTRFELDFIAANQVRYRYQVEFDRTRILHESLDFYRPGASIQKSVNLFRKEEDGHYTFQVAYKGPQKEVAKLTAPNQLLLSKAAVNNPNEHVAAVHAFIDDKIKIFSFDRSFDEETFAQDTKKILDQNPEYLLHISELMRAVDADILEIRVNERDLARLQLPENLPPPLKQQIIEQIKRAIEVKHRMFDGEKEEDDGQFFPLENESTGTQKLVSVLAIMLDAFYNGQVLLIDELDKSLNPYWTKYIIKLFYDDRFNKKATQLVFVSHDAVQLQDFLFAKDQVNLIEKDYYGRTEIRNLADFSGLRKDVPLEKRYLSGVLGGVPVIRDKFIVHEVGHWDGAEKA